MQHVDLCTDYLNEFALGSREYKEPEKVLQSLQHLLILSGYHKVHTDKGKGKGKRKGNSGGSDQGDDAPGADDADETISHQSLSLSSCAPIGSRVMPCGCGNRSPMVQRERALVVLWQEGGSSGPLAEHACVESTVLFARPRVVFLWTTAGSAPGNSRSRGQLFTKRTNRGAPPTPSLPPFRNQCRHDSNAPHNTTGKHSCVGEFDLSRRRHRNAPSSILRCNKSQRRSGAVQ